MELPYKPTEQFCPVNPAAQLHEKSLTASAHVPPFWHGSVAQSSMSVAHNKHALYGVQSHYRTGVQLWCVHQCVNLPQSSLPVCELTTEQSVDVADLASATRRAGWANQKRHGAAVVTASQHNNPSNGRNERISQT